jgi:hypothetical protein
MQHMHSSKHGQGLNEQFNDMGGHSKITIRKMMSIWYKSVHNKKRYRVCTLSFSSADIPSASGCLICPDFIRTAQLVQQPNQQNQQWMFTN